VQLTVIGAYLPRLDQTRLERWIADDVASFKSTIRELRTQGIAQTTDEEIELRAEELPEELNYDLQRAALFEVEVLNNSAAFEGSCFQEHHSTAASWEPVFLSLSGDAVVCEKYEAPADLRNFRIVFYIHDWPDNGVLEGPTGVLPLPSFTPVPERLWILAPYSLVD
jgi:hypothetical protein